MHTNGINSFFGTCKQVACVHPAFLVLIVNVDSRARPVKREMNCKNVMKKFFVSKKVYILAYGNQIFNGNHYHKAVMYIQTLMGA